MTPNFEKQFLTNQRAILFCDEVGRGPIAGPVNSCTVIYDDASKVSEINSLLIEMGVNDSKKLSEKKRRTILEKIGIDLIGLEVGKIYDHKNFRFVIKEKAPAEIDDINILQASLLSMAEGCLDLISSSSLVLVDGNKIFDLEIISNGRVKNESNTVVSVVKGDAKSAGISLASIIAKEYRDLLMQRLDKVYPGYGFAQHAGYPTAFHKEAVKNLGVTPIHRRSFKGVKEYI